VPALADDQRIAIKSGDLFFLCGPGGDVPPERDHALGLFYHDCRFLNGYTLTIAGEKPKPLANEASEVTVTLRLCNPQLRIGAQTLLKNSFEIQWSRVVNGERLALFDTISLHSLTNDPIRFILALSFRAQFEDIFAVRGFAQTKRGRLHLPAWKNGDLCFFYRGADRIDREVIVQLSPLPNQRDDASASYEIALAPSSERQLKVCVFVSESPRRTVKKLLAPSHPSEKTRIRSDNDLFNRVMARSLGDLEMLRSGSDNFRYFAAGIPWYVALFGRDSIITALQMLAYDAQIAEQTIRLLALHQGKEVNDWRDEEPGKILHELRVGEMANLNEIPHTPYYGTIDATPLWLMLIGRHAAWTGDLRLFNELRPHIEAALNWIENYGDSDGDGYVEYQCKSGKGLSNQGWKDSADGIVNADGSLGVPPIALVEVQAYVYAAKFEMAALYRRVGDGKRANILERDAQQLRERFNRDFWVADGYYALALQNGKQHAAVLSSNAGHALWCGIAESDRAKRTADHLLSPEMFSGWGIRTLSAATLRYDPLSYHLGTVWPHDNSIIAAGLKRYGCDEGAMRVLSGLLEAASHFETHRLPELFGGFAREDRKIPVPYPISCQPQAWSAGAIPYLLTILLGLEPDAFDRRLRIVRPVLPENINRVEVNQLRVGAARVDLLFERKGGEIVARDVSVDGDLEIVLEL
jgi:glycogen debranching enzyme